MLVWELCELCSKRDATSLIREHTQTYKHVDTRSVYKTHREVDVPRFPRKPYKSQGSLVIFTYLYARTHAHSDIYPSGTSKLPLKTLEGSTHTLTCTAHCLEWKWTWDAPISLVRDFVRLPRKSRRGRKPLRSYRPSPALINKEMINLLRLPRMCRRGRKLHCSYRQSPALITKEINVAFAFN